MATLLTTIARRCIDQYEGVRVEDFYALDALELLGYCSERLIGILFEESLSRRPQTMGRCIGEARQDKDLEVAFKHLDYLNRNNQHIALDRLRHNFMVVLAHTIKAELYAELEDLRVFGARS